MAISVAATPAVVGAIESIAVSTMLVPDSVDEVGVDSVTSVTGIDSAD